MNLIEIIPKHELELIDEYRKWYAPGGYGVKSEPAPIEEVLQVWSNAKQNLFKTLFKDRLIIEETILFKQEGDVCVQELYSLIESEVCKEIYHYLSKEIKLYNPQIGEEDIYNFLDCIFGINGLKTNIYAGSDLYIFKPDSNTLKIQRGCKTLKLLQKLGKAFGKEEEIEQFRLKHSMIVNHKIIEGTLCLSIHPFDYMTMSDNESDWHTCMSWTQEDGGEYKQGTVEMMNSSCVVVAYLKSDNREFLWGEHPHQEWNNKKWRQLFIINPKYVLGIKPYPYENENLTKTAQAKIVELLGWKSKLYPFRASEQVSCGKQKVYLKPIYGEMYNDFNRCEHWIAINPEVKEDISEDIYVSGFSQCMICGKTFHYEENPWWAEKMLGCEDCLNAARCDHCGSIVDLDGEEVRAFQNRWLCECCYIEEVIKDSITGEEVYYDSTTQIYLSHSDDCYASSWRTRSFRTAIPPSDLVGEYFKEICLEEGIFEDTYYVKPKDLTEQGLKLFALTDENGLSDYMNYY